ncbi:MAG TPA: molybdopterin dinucleotide binding domain-containing protein [Symbiobacteriaceae bacterium]|nr:molybdopterin dinucleotide binding domain-containing protein [Symbiobacteriaceae bacterium]
MRYDGQGTKLPLSLGSIQALPLVVESGDPYPVKAGIFFRINPVKSSGDSARWIKALQKLELVVAIDTQMSETAQYAHYILPESHYLERMDVISVAGDTVSVRQPVIKPLYDTKPGYEIIQGLAKAAGVGEYFDFTIEQYNEAQLSPSGWSLEALKEKGVLKVAMATPPDYSKVSTTSGKAELVHEGFANSGGTRVVGWVAPKTRPEGDKLRLLHGHQAVHSNGYTQNVPALYARMPENELWIHPQAAAARGIKHGEYVEVANELGKERIKAKVTEGIRPDCVWMCHGFGTMSPEQHLAYKKGANDGALYPILVTPVTGALGQGEAVVTVRKAGDSR